MRKLTRKLAHLGKRDKAPQEQLQLPNCSNSSTGNPREPSKAPAAVLFPEGIKILHDCPDAVVDVCFIHGLTGDRERTWTATGQKEPWPKTLLPAKLEKARILTYGYDAYVVRKERVSTNRLSDHAVNFLKDLVDDRATAHISTRPIIFVAHSLGGLICKKALLLSRNPSEHHLRSIFESTKGIIFMGTPHKGSCMARWASIPVSALGLIMFTNPFLLDVLQWDDQYLGSIQNEFLEMLREQRESGRQLEVTCFFEELPLTTQPRIGVVVPKVSAVLEGYNPLSIHADHRDMVRFASEEELGFKRVLGELTRWRNQIVHSVSTTLSDTHRECLRSLAFPELNDRANDVDKATKGTCEWLMQHETYQNWASGTGGLLWIKGKPGSGKSTLLKHTLRHHGTTLNASKDDLLLSFFFHDRGSNLQKSPLGFSRSLLHQALVQMPAALPELVEAFNNKRHSMDDWSWHQKELQYFFEMALPRILRLRRVWLFVDALDECGKDNAIKLLQWLKGLTELVSSARIQLRICVTCRHYPILGPASELEICTEVNNEHDIAVYVDDQFREYGDLAKSPIPKLITGRASGVFMWARLVVEQIQQLRREGEELEEMMNVIDSIPMELNELYDKLVQDMRQKKSSLKLMQWICFATRPLRLGELAWAMVIDCDRPLRRLEEYQSRENFPHENDMIILRVKALSCGLAETTTSYQSRTVSYRGSSDGMPAKTSMSVQFIHQSVKDYFISEGLSVLGGTSTPTDAALVAHSRLARTCVHYLAVDEIALAVAKVEKEFESKYTRDGAHALLVEFPFIEYTTTSWVEHAKQSDTESLQANLLRALDWPSNERFSLWRQVWGMIFQYAPRREMASTATLVHVTSLNGIEQLLKAIISQTPPSQSVSFIDSVDRRGRTPLSWAAAEGEGGVIRQLLDTGQVEVDSKDNDSRTPLSWAAQMGRKNAIRQLLDTGQVEVDSKDNEGQTPLSWAAYGGEEGVIRQLLDTGQVEVDSKDNKGRTPLSWAAQMGCKNAIRQLLDTGQVEVDSKDNDGRTPLSWAASSGSEGVIKQLLDTGQVEVDSKDNEGQTPLLWAAYGGEEGVIRQLLETGQVEVDSKDNEGRTPLSWAASSGSEGVIKQLLDTGQVEVDSKDNKGRTPLSWAAQMGCKNAIRQLLDTGQVEVDSKDNDGRTPLSWAAAEGCEDVVTLLVSNAKVDVNSKDRKGRTPLMWAARRGQTAVVKLLLENRQVDFNAKDDDGLTALEHARMVLDKSENDDMEDDVVKDDLKSWYDFQWRRYGRVSGGAYWRHLESVSEMLVRRELS